MQYSALLLLAAATAVTANLRAHPIPLPKRAVEARQTDDFPEPTDTSSSDPEPSGCESSAYSLETSMPTAPPDLESYYASYTSTGSCINVPSSLTSDYEDYTSSVDSWYSANSDDVSSFLDACTDYEVDLISDYCTENADDASSTGGAGSALTTTDDSKSTATSTGTTKTSATGTKTAATGTTTATAGAAVRDVGIVGAVLAGALGMAVVL